MATDNNNRRTPRLNSLLKEVISDVIRKQTKNPNISELTTVMSVEITKDLRDAKVFISVIGDDSVKKATVDALNSASGFIGVQASKLVVMRYFPTLVFKIDKGVDHHMRIDEILKKIDNKGA